MAPVLRAPGDARLGWLTAIQVRWGVPRRALVRETTRLAVGPAVEEGAMTDEARSFAGIDWATRRIRPV